MSRILSNPRSLGVLALVLAFALLLRSDTPAHAFVYEVDRTDDVFAASACTNAPDDCSLRGAVERANIVAGADVIELPIDATFHLTLLGTFEDDNQTGDLDVLQAVTINGNGSTIDADDIDRILDVPAGSSKLTLNDLTITDGFAAGTTEGGGVRLTTGSIVADDLTLTGNEATYTGGGMALAENVSATLTDLVVTDNVAGTPTSGAGGGVFKQSGAGPVTITGGLFDNNTSLSGGGASLAGPVTLVDVDFNDNTATGTSLGFGGGLLFEQGDLQMTGGSFTGNDSGGYGGGAVIQIEAHLSGVVVAGNTAQYGAGIYSSGNDNTFELMTISGNVASQQGGGAGLFGGTISTSEVTGNSAVHSGGGVWIGNDTVINHSLVYNNTTGGFGGGVYQAQATATVTNSTITGNTAALGGGGISKGDSNILPNAVPQGGPTPGPLTVTFSTIAANTSPVGANIALFPAAGTLPIRGSIVADAVTGPNCNTTLDSFGYNVEDANTCGFDENGDRPGTDPMLDVLANNTGPTRTKALLEGSSAIDAVEAGCPPPSDDQRGVLRPNGAECDAGAFESNFGPSVTPSPTISPSPSPTSTGQQRKWGDVHCDNGVDAGDALAVLLTGASTAATPTLGCHTIGQTVTVNGVQRKFGDHDCNGTIGANDALLDLAFAAGTPPDPIANCPTIGSTVTIS